jgi:hypothetical protein
MILRLISYSSLIITAFTGLTLNVSIKENVFSWPDLAQEDHH